jgi:hypothetical protein
VVGEDESDSRINASGRSRRAKRSIATTTSVDVGDAIVRNTTPRTRQWEPPVASTGATHPSERGLQHCSVRRARPPDGRATFAPPSSLGDRFQARPLRAWANIDTRVTALERKCGMTDADAEPDTAYGDFPLRRFLAMDVSSPGAGAASATIAVGSAHLNPNGVVRRRAVRLLDTAMGSAAMSVLPTAPITRSTYRPLHPPAVPDRSPRPSMW